MPTDRPGFAYPPTTIDETDPSVIARKAARTAAYDAARARGLSEKAARLEAARADASWVRVQAGLSSGEEEEAAYQRGVAERKARAKRLGKLAPKQELRIGVKGEAEGMIRNRPH